MHVLPKHEIAGDGNGDVEGIGEYIGVIDSSGVFGRVAHVAVDVWEDGVPAPGGHKKAKREGEVRPTLWPERGYDRGAQRAWGLRFERPVDEN